MTHRNFGIPRTPHTIDPAIYDPSIDWYRDVQFTMNPTVRMRRRRFLQRLVFVLACGVGAGIILTLAMYGFLSLTGQAQ